MNDKRVSMGQDLAWRLEALGFDIFTAFFRALPVDWASSLGGAVCRLLGPLTPNHAVARRNLELAFPEKDAAWHRMMLDKQWESVGRGFAEFPLLDRLRVANGRVEVVGGERLAEIAGGGKPAVFVSGHLSTFEVMPACILEAGIPCEITYRAANNPYVDARIK
jgi:KDO2-lipid IV(A) lauroyltransferase